MTSDTARLSGSIGYSLCRDGNASAACPIYVGSMHLEASSTLSVDLECPDGSFETVDLEDLVIELGQPAMGIHQGGSSNAAFPSRSLVFDATFNVGNIPLAVRGLSEVPVHVTASSTEFEALDVQFRGDAPCAAGGTGVATGAFDVALRISGAGMLDSPPTISIDMATTTTCGQTLSFSGQTSDPDNDVDETRWYVDGVLMSTATTGIEVNGPHTVTAVVTDDRGAAATDEVSISCT